MAWVWGPDPEDEPPARDDDRPTLAELLHRIFTRRKDDDR